VPRSTALTRLQAATKRLDAATAQAQEAREKWLRAIQEARDEGASIRAIGVAAGISRTRVMQILRGE
jgi:hypothetical protein